ncbi:MAG: DUF547 domain-containing protein [Planctomycetes bacterium]|nr:DUF547 domain-containing protein [Planctomycetota bacterium]
MNVSKSVLWVGTALAVALLIASVIGFLSRPEPQLLQFNAAAAPSEGFSYKDYRAVLNTFVNEENLVDYKGLKAAPGRLDAFAAALGKLDRKAYETWTEKGKIAFWINAYNALTLEAIVTHYPIQPSLTASLLYPKNSIRQISGVWDRLRFVAMGKERTLSDIEHEILRKKFNEPRIHMALVCAAMGCPPLRNEPYVAEKLDPQLDDQTRRFLSNPKKFRIDRDAGTVYLSPIFKWFGGDFVGKFAAEEGFARHGAVERAVLNFISGYLAEKDAAYLRERVYTIQYLPYDWTLNGQRERAK